MPLLQICFTGRRSNDDKTSRAWFGIFESKVCKLPDTNRERGHRSSRRRRKLERENRKADRNESKDVVDKYEEDIPEKRMIGEIKIKNMDAVERTMTNKQTYKDFPDTPLVTCPRCKLLVPDWDGFGVLAHLELKGRERIENFPKACGYCSHPALDGKICGICGEEEGTREYEEKKKTRR